MPCYHPLQASFSLRPDGKKDMKFSSRLAYDADVAFRSGVKLPSFVSDSVRSLPCGSCMGCRLERSRQWATRCMHEASLYEDNCFITLTYGPDFLPSDGSLDRKCFPLFMKRLRQHFSDLRIRYYMCGEYGDNFHRPHYHACMFGLDFPDKCFLTQSGDYNLYSSPILDKLWGKGFCSIGDLSFDTAAYVARYCTKKITGSQADDHYCGRQPEFGLQSNRPGIGADWYKKWKGDCFPSDYLIVNGSRCKPPRYYDKLLERENPLLFERIKQSRLENAVDDEDASHHRLLAREKCHEARMKNLVRTIERR